MTGAVRRALRPLAELFALWGFAFVQPVLDVFGRAPQQFAFRGVDRLDIVVFALAVMVPGPVALWGAELVAGALDRRARPALHLVVVGALVAAFTVQAARPIATGAPLMALATIAGIAAVVLYVRTEASRTWLAFAALAPVAFAALFLTSSASSRLLSSVDPVEGGGVVGNPAPVVLLVFDELPLASVMDADGSIDAELFPNLAALADDSHFFRNATSVSNSTWHAAPALVTGQLPEQGDVPVAADHPDSLFTLLDADYDLNVVESVTRVCPAELCATESVGGLPALLWDASEVVRSRLSYSGDTGDAVAVMVDAPAAATRDDGGFADIGFNQPARLQSFLDDIRDDRPAVHYLHLLLPHVPFRYLPSGVVYDGPNPDVGRIDDDWVDDPWPPALGRQRHLLQVGYVDALLGEVLGTLRERGTYDEALVIVTSDHGVSFRAGEPIRGLEGQEIDDDVLADLAWVPLLVKEPDQQVGTVSDANVLSIDLLPTIADVLDVAVPWDVDGQSVFTPRSDPAKPFLPGTVTGFGVDLEPTIRVDERVDPADVRRNAVDRFLAAVDDPLRWWRTGPRPDLVGTAVDTARGELAELDATLVAVDPVVEEGSGTVPALIRGRAPGLAAGDEVVVAVNGTIGATAPVFTSGGRPTFAVIVSDALFRDGDNDIEVFRITGP